MPKQTNLDCIKTEDAQRLVMRIALFVWKTLCECNGVQQMKCERIGGMPEGGCLEHITDDARYWLESEVDNDAE